MYPNASFFSRSTTSLPFKCGDAEIEILQLKAFENQSHFLSAACS